MPIISSRSDGKQYFVCIINSHFHPAIPNDYFKATARSEIDNLIIPLPDISKANILIEETWKVNGD